MSKYGAGVAKDCSGRVDWKYIASVALPYVHYYDVLLDSGADRFYRSSIFALGSVSSTEGFKNKTAEVAYSLDGFDHFGLDAKEDTQTGYTACVWTVCISNFEMVLGRRTRFQLSFIPMAVTFARGSQFGPQMLRMMRLRI